MLKNPLNTSAGLQAFIVITILGLGFHFAFTLVYCFREQAPPGAVAIADRYMVPCFHQNWKLFAPDLPRYNVELEYRIATDNTWTDWRDASASFGFGKTSVIETVEQGFNTNLGWQLLNNLYSSNGEIQFDRVTHTPAYASAMYFVMKLHQASFPGVKQEMIQLRLHYRFNPAPGSGGRDHWQQLEFPAFIPQ